MAEDVTQLLTALSHGSDSAVNELMPVVYQELRRLADSLLRAERPDHTLQTTALVHEAYLKLVEQRNVQWRDGVHFYAVAAQVMRRILVDHARSRQRLKRGGKRNKLPLDTDAGLTIELEADPIDLLALNEALDKLSKLQPQAARVVEMRYFAGLNSDDIGLALGVSGRTVEREWRYARAWLFDELGLEENA